MDKNIEDVLNDNDNFIDSSFKKNGFGINLVKQMLRELDIPFNSVEVRQMDFSSGQVKDLFMNDLVTLTEHDDTELFDNIDKDEPIDEWQLMSDNNDNLYLFTCEKNKHTTWNEELYLIKID